MKKVIVLVVFSVFSVFNVAQSAFACTNLIVGKGASTDGSVLVSYNADSYGMYGTMYRHMGRKHAKGEMRQIIEWDTNKPLGEIPEAEMTYNVVGQMNENQVSITETTFGGNESLMDSTSIIDYGSLIYIALERSKTAREAISIMTTLVKDYGFCSAGETFTICDKNEAWVMEMMGKGPGGKGAVWAAVRIPDDCISAHANQSRITKFLKLYPRENVMYSDDCIDFARSKGLFSGNDEDFSFRDAYAPADFSANRYCEARVWSFFNKHVSGMDRYLPYVLGKNKAFMNDEMPLYLKPGHKVSLQDVMAGMRDHYEGTVMDITTGIGAGNYQMPYRPTPLETKKVIDGKEVAVFNERPISTQQSGFGYVGQMRSWLPDAVGGIVWWTNDDPNMAPYVPVYCGVKEIPACFVRVQGVQDEVTFSWESAFWMQNMVANMVYPYYNKMFPDLQAKRDALEGKFLSSFLAEKNADTKALTKASLAAADEMMAAWKQLHQYLVVRHNDMIIKGVDAEGNFTRTQYGFQGRATKPGYSDDYWKRILGESGDKYLVP